MRNSRDEAVEFYRELIAALPDVVWSNDDSGAFRFLSPNVERICGFSAEACLAAGIDGWFARIHPDDCVAVESAYLAFARGELASFDVEYRFRRGDGEWRWLRSRATARHTGVITDITDRRALEEGLRQAQKMETLGVLAGGIAHDFNNLLSVILTDASALVSQLDEGDPRRIEAREIEDAATRAGALTRQLLLFSRSTPAHRELLSLDAVVADVSKMLRRVIGEDVVLRVKSETVGRVQMDRSELEQMLLNFAINARDAMPKGGELTIETSDVMLAGEPHARIVITDTGVGITPAVQARMFEPFFTTKPAGRGTGLGLSTIDAVVTHAGGTISVRSEVGRGTEFTVDLPAVMRRKMKHTSLGVAALGGSERIVVLEDDGTVRAAIGRILRSSGYEVVEATDGDDALRIIIDDPDVDLVISDVVLPGRSGPELLADLRGIRPGLPRLFISGYSEHAALLASVVEDRGRFLAKPFRPEELRRKVREILG